MTGSRPAQRAAHRAHSVSKEVVDSDSFGALIMVGLIVYGIVHLLVAWITAQVAWTGSGTQASQQGAFQEMASTPVGDVLLWVTAGGLLILALWQVFEAIWGHRDASAGGSRTLARLGSAGKAIVYVGLSISAISTAVGSGSGGNSEKTWTGRLMSAPLGRVLVAVIGVAVIAVGAVTAYRGVKKKFAKSLAGPVRPGVLRLGQIGYLAKGFAFAIVGVLFIVAAITHDPQRSGGLDSAIRTLRQQPYGVVLLTVVAAGFACFGLYCFAWSRHAKRS